MPLANKDKSTRTLGSKQDQIQPIRASSTFIEHPLANGPTNDSKNDTPKKETTTTLTLFNEHFIQVYELQVHWSQKRSNLLDQKNNF